MYILILDADPLVLTTLTDTLRRRLPGVIVHAATSFHVGLKKLLTRGYDAVIIDAELPDASGTAALSILHQRYPNIAVVLMTGQMNHMLMASATLSGVYYYLHKPIEPNVFLAVLNRVMEYTRFGLQIDHLTAKATRHTKRTRKAIAFSRLLLEAKDNLLSRRQQSLAQTEERSDRLVKVLDGIPRGVLALDQFWRIVWLNDAVPRCFRAGPREKLLGRDVWALCSDMAGSVFERECRRAVGKRIAVRFFCRFPGSDQGYEVDASPHADGLSLLFHHHGGSLPEGSEQPSHERGLSDQHPLLTSPGEKPATDSLPHHSGRPHQSSDDSTHDSSWRHLAEQVQSAREAERARIARDLHDDLDQLLTALKMDLAWLDARLSLQQIPALLKVRFMAHLVNRITDALRRICSELRPAILDDLGLAAAMQWQASTFEHRTGLRCIVTLKGLDRLDTERSTGLFRVFQELLTHVPLHPRATVVWITMKEEPARLTMEVSDNGQDSQASDLTAKAKHFVNLNERLFLLGGDLSLQRHGGENASIFITIPLMNGPMQGNHP